MTRRRHREIHRRLALYRKNAEQHRLIDKRQYYRGKADGMEYVLPLVEQLTEQLANAERTIEHLLRETISASKKLKDRS